MGVGGGGARQGYIQTPVALTQGSTIGEQRVISDDGIKHVRGQRGWGEGLSLLGAPIFPIFLLLLSLVAASLSSDTAWHLEISTQERREGGGQDVCCIPMLFGAVS